MASETFLVAILIYSQDRGGGRWCPKTRTHMLFNLPTLSFGQRSAKQQFYIKSSRKSNRQGFSKVAARVGRKH